MISTLNSPTSRANHRSYSFGLTGYPLGHSLSPQIHASALHALGLNGEYTLYPVRPLPEGAVELKELLTRMRNDEIHGLNVTIPHKQQIIPLLDGLTEAATRIGAVNTIFKIDGRLLGDNTDASGFWADVQRITYNDVRTAVVLGAGGSARAVTYALLTRGYRLVIAAGGFDHCGELFITLPAAPHVAGIDAILGQ